MNFFNTATFSLEELKQRQETALKLAALAGEMMLQARQSGDFTEAYKGHEELVTSVDKEIDDFLCQQLSQAFPEDTILSE